MKKTLILSYSQTGQTDRAVKEFSSGLKEFSECDWLQFSVKESIPFPWRFTSFFRMFPRCILGIAPDLELEFVDFSKYDLIVLVGQVWFLSPSLPLQSFLQHHVAQGLECKNVLVMLTCRNMWYSSVRILKEKLLQLKANPVGQIVICEISPLWASFVTTPRWMLTGKKTAFAFFPQAGIDDKEFEKLPALGRVVGQKLQNSSLHEKPIHYTNLDRLSVRLMETIGRKFFELWACVINALSPKEGKAQDLVLVMFRVTLVLLILLLLPITKTIEIVYYKLFKLKTRGHS